MAWNLMEFNGMYLVRQDIPNKLMIFGSNKKNNRIPPFPKKRSCLKRIKVTIQRRMVVEAGTLYLDNDKNNIIANKILSYFYCLSSKFEVYIASFRTK